MNAIFVLNKPAGMTSNTAVQRLRRLLGEKRAGHGGTLDPQATGVLPVCVGQAAKLFDYFEDAGKEYVAEITFGLTSDTQDIWGKLEHSEGQPCVTRAALEEVLPRFIGQIQQIPPMYSAIKQNGRKLYELARAGQVVDRPPRAVIIDSIAVEEEPGENRFVLRVACSKGTYIRTLCHDLGQALGCGAVMSALTRTRSGSFGIKDAVTLEQLEQAVAQGQLGQAAYPLEKALAHYPAFAADPSWEKALNNGVAIADELAPAGLCRVYLRGVLLGLGQGWQEQGISMLKMKLLLQGEQL
ncbi:MAG: tRNA pseudouridine(55) synthase TruB [Eubacteriales bacterium]|nr:tRNA pseudouridine(55) synthase TruB [Eubacteriales bacterium]